MPSKQSEFKGHKVLTILDPTKEDGKNFIVTFGVRKAKAILAHIKDIQDFVDANGGV